MGAFKTFFHLAWWRRLVLGHNYEKAMQNMMKGRKFEVVFVLVCVAIYVVKRLFEEARAFDRFIFDMYNLPPEQRDMAAVWRGLVDYSHFANTMLPIVAGGALFFAAWYVFHIWLFPKLKAKEFTASTLVLGVFTLVLVFSSVFVHNYFKLYYREVLVHAVGNSGEAFDKINGAVVYSKFRKIFWLNDAVAVLLILVLYEAAAQAFYYVQAKLREEDNNVFIGYVLEGGVCVFLLVLAFVGHLPQKDYWIGPIRELALLGLSGIVGFLAQDYFYRKCMPYVSDIKSKAFSVGFKGYLFILLAGSFLIHLFQVTIWAIYSRSYFRISPPYLLMIFTVLLVMSLAMAFLRRVFSKEKRALRTEISNKTAELGNLRSQINPHFLFNALNTLYSVSLKENANMTSEGIQKLGDMMRFMLEENHQDRILLSKEIEYLENFIAIQRMRVDENQDIKLEINIQKTDKEVFVAPMLLVPFVENAFKHGISFRSPSWIFITLTHDAQHLYFKVHNSIHTKQELGQPSHGIGLENVKKRLEMIYPNRHKLEIQETEHDFFVSLVLGVY
ncbi:sensor protein lytS [Lacihabitans sp. LS3-19]|nr:sensor protein lytS [Lacihabitans sp. LS3-19]